MRPTGYYAGVGSRQTPEKTLTLMTSLAGLLGKDGWILRSGHAIGADRAFEEGADNTQRNRSLKLEKHKEIFTPKARLSAAAFKMAESIHPAWHNCDEYARACHARNCYQILGSDLATPVKFVLCWTSCGSECEDDTSRSTGGTRTAIVLADRENIPVFNLKNDGALLRFRELVQVGK